MAATCCQSIGLTGVKRVEKYSVGKAAASLSFARVPVVAVAVRLSRRVTPLTQASGGGSAEELSNCKLPKKGTGGRWDGPRVRGGAQRGGQIAGWHAAGGEDSSPHSSPGGPRSVRTP